MLQPSPWTRLDCESQVGVEKTPTQSENQRDLSLRTGRGSLTSEGDAQEGDESLGEVLGVYFDSSTDCLVFLVLVCFVGEGLAMAEGKLVY
jgi:hypothetical protein